VYVASQLGHTDPIFTLRLYAQAVRHRSKLTPAERRAFEEAVIWAQLGADPPYDLLGDVPAAEAVLPQQPDLQAVLPRHSGP
jgi:hypothetical protein